MGKYFSINKNNIGGNKNGFLTEPFQIASLSDADYTEINPFCDLYREAKREISCIVPNEEDDFIEEIERKQFLEDITDIKDFDKKAEYLKGARKGLRETYAKDVVIGAMVSTCCKKTGVDDAWRFASLFNRGKFSSIEYHGEGDKFQKTVKALTDPNTNQKTKEKIVKARVDSLMKEYYEMSFPKDNEAFFNEYEGLMDKASVMENLANIVAVSGKYNIPIDKMTSIKMKALSEFGNAYKKVMTGRAQKTADPLYPEVGYDNIPEYYRLAYGNFGKIKSLYADGFAAMEEYGGQMQRGYTKLVMADKGLDPDNSMVFISGKEGVQSIDVVGTPEHNKEPLIIFGPDGQFKAYIDFFENGTMVEEKETVIMSLNIKNKSAFEKTKESANNFLKEFKDNDSILRGSSKEYKNILAGLEKLGKESEKLNIKLNAKQLLKDCEDYIEMAKKKTEMSEYATKRFLAVQKLKRSLQASFTKDNLDKYLAKEKAKNAKIEQEKSIKENKIEDNVERLSRVSNASAAGIPNVEEVENEFLNKENNQTLDKPGSLFEKTPETPDSIIKEITKEPTNIGDGVNNDNNINNINIVNNKNEQTNEKEEIFFNDVISKESINDYEPGEEIKEKSEKLSERIYNDIIKEDEKFVEKNNSKDRSLIEDIDKKLPEKGDNGLGI